MKFKNLPHFVAAAVMLISGATHSHAETFADGFMPPFCACVTQAVFPFNFTVSGPSLGELSPGAPRSFNAVRTNGPFNDFLSFVAPASQSLGFSVINLPVTGLFNTLLTSASVYSNPDGIMFNADDSLVSSGLASGGISLTTGPTTRGIYYLNVEGVANGPQGGLYSGAASVAAVPEPQTFAMLLAGLGVIGFVARHRNSKGKLPRR